MLAKPKIAIRGVPYCSPGYGEGFIPRLLGAPTLKDVLIKLDIILIFKLREENLDFRTMSVLGDLKHFFTT